MQRHLKNFWTETQGQDLVEYALMAGMVAVVALASMPPLTATLNTVFTRIMSVITTYLQ